MILKLLGKGGMGAVYLVSDTHLGSKECALKEMSDSGIIDPIERQKAVQSFRQEAQMLSTLSHPGLPRVTDYFSLEMKHFLVMDYVSGQSLLDMLETRGHPFPETQVLDWATQLCDVLYYLHSLSPPIIYRDLKPENIIVSPDGKRVRLIDFGAARTFKSSKTKDTTAIGTPGFAPPEQFGKGQTDARSDIYALGATLHQLLTFHDPGIKLFHFPTLRSLNSMVSKHVESAIMKAVEKDRFARWGSAMAFRQALLSSTPSPIPVPVRTSTPAATPPPTILKPSAPPVSPPAKFPLQPATPIKHQVYQPPMDYAEHGPRFGAYLLDGVIITVGSLLLSLPFSGFQSEESLVILIGLLVIWSLGYYTFFHARSGQTPGKKAAGLRVVCEGSSPPSWGRALWRAIVFLYLPLLLTITCYLGWLLMFVPLVHGENRGFHDLLAGTWVVRD